jgi:FkbM family methyltransferase
MKLANRSMKTMLEALFQKQHWKAAANMFSVYDHPMDAYSRYLFARGACPVSISLRTPLGKVSPTLYSHHDMLTVNEIFCRQDYRASASDRVIVDFGSNIGISALYFLTRGGASFVYCHEPVPTNCEKLQRNLRGFRGRYQLAECAVALEDGTAEFGCEPSGRYGGIGKITGTSMTVECQSAVNILGGILKNHGEVDILKIDIETLERELLLSIPERMLARIGKIYIEQRFAKNPLARTHSFGQYGAIAQFFRAADVRSTLECGSSSYRLPPAVHTANQHEAEEERR